MPRNRFDDEPVWYPRRRRKANRGGSTAIFIALGVLVLIGVSVAVYFAVRAKKSQGDRNVASSSEKSSSGSADVPKSDDRFLGIWEGTVAGQPTQKYGLSVDAGGNWISSHTNMDLDLLLRYDQKWKVSGNKNGNAQITLTSSFTLDLPQKRSPLETTKETLWEAEFNGDKRMILRRVAGEDPITITYSKIGTIEGLFGAAEYPDIFAGRSRLEGTWRGQYENDSFHDVTLTFIRSGQFSIQSRNVGTQIIAESQQGTWKVLHTIGNDIRLELVMPNTRVETTVRFTESTKFWAILTGSRKFIGAR